MLSKWPTSVISRYDRKQEEVNTKNPKLSCYSDNVLAAITYAFTGNLVPTSGKTIMFFGSGYYRLLFA